VLQNFSDEPYNQFGLSSCNCLLAYPDLFVLIFLTNENYLASFGEATNRAGSHEKPDSKRCFYTIDLTGSKVLLPKTEERYLTNGH
jgi:hypothetical protein